MDLVRATPRILGDAAFARFGAEFPIRFDFLDTMQGGNLSLQVHPLNQYIIDNFGMAYTQDESYYLLDAAPDACVCLGLKTGIDRNAMISELHRAQEGGSPFEACKYVTSGQLENMTISCSRWHYPLLRSQQHGSGDQRNLHLYL
jgi:mannose-6-phosphate isomerase class I